MPTVTWTTDELNGEVRKENTMDNVNIINANEEVKENKIMTDSKLIFDENGNVVGITEETKRTLIDQIREMFDWCECYPECNDEALGKTVDMWIKAKSRLLTLFSKHPNYNGNFAIEFNKPIFRSFDTNTYKDILEAFEALCYKKMETVPFPIPCYDYNELNDIIERLNNEVYYLSCLTDMRRVRNLYEDRYNEVTKERDHFQHIIDLVEYDDKYYVSCGRIYLRDVYRKHKNVKLCLNKLRNNPNQFLTDSVAEYINEKLPDFKAKEGMKSSKAINKLCKMVGLDKFTHKEFYNEGYYDLTDGKEENLEKNGYNYAFARLADACNPFASDKHIFISLHPIDYLSMAWGTTWTSCHTIDKDNKHKYDPTRTGQTYRGCSSSGCESYMLDETSVTMFILGKNAVKEAEEKGEPVPRKEIRQMFHIGKEVFIQGRLYPYDQSDRGQNATPEDYVQYREIVQNLLSELNGTPNLWKIKRGSSYCGDYSITYGTHYPDYLHYSNPNVSILKDNIDTDEKIIIGHKPICPRCGKEHNDSDNTFCYSCLEGGESFYCEYHEQTEYGESVEVEGYGTVCRDAIDGSGDFSYCSNCQSWHYNSCGDDGVYISRGYNDYWFCDNECANNYGFYWLESENDYVYEDDFSYSEIDQEDIAHDNDEAVWAYYEEDSNDTTIAWRDSCVYYDGDWYAESICEEDVNGDMIPREFLTEVYIDEFDTVYVYTDDLDNGDYTRYEGDWYTDDCFVEVNGKRVLNWEVEFYVDVDGKDTPVDMTEMEELDRVA